MAISFVCDGLTLGYGLHIRLKDPVRINHIHGQMPGWFAIIKYTLFSN